MEPVEVGGGVERGAVTIGLGLPLAAPGEGVAPDGPEFQQALAALGGKPKKAAKPGKGPA